MKRLKSLSLQKILDYAKPYKKRFNWVVAFAISLSIFAAIRPYMLKITVDEYVQPQNKTGLLLYIGLMGIVLLLEVLSQFFFTYWASWLGQDIVKDMREKLFDKIISFRMRYFDNEPVGKLVTRAVSDIESIASIFSQGLFMIVSDLLKMFVVLCIMFYMNWKLSCIVLVAMPILLYATRVFQQHMKTAFQEVRTQISNLNTFVQERLTGMKIVQLFGREEIEYKKFKEINHKHNVAWLKNILYNSIFFPIADIVSSLTLGFVIWYGGMSIVQGDNLTSFGDLFAYTMLITILFNPLRQIADKFNVMQMGIIAAERVFDVLETEEQIDDNGTIVAPQFKGKIELKDVHFSYIKGIEILKGINLDIEPGTTIAIVGSSGAGKSTIINLLNRFYDINSGSICIDGVDINEFKLATLRKQVAVVLQDVFLFSDTIYNNITLNDESISRETVIEAAKKIGIHDFIMQLPGGYDYNVKERGVMLSSGQRQLIAFLRAYVSNPSILILDEATSSIDTHSEELLQKATDYLTKDRTSIIIAHRLATIVNADQIIVMDKGKIVEKGTHKDLLEIADGYYKNLYESQFNKEL
ncbi:ABC transporter ATP-binding protein [Myroides marinus]|uniref:ABC transporter ATP-binding protein n=1 Tax=Myroides marinus TaxID=703342 RepID=UPI0025782A45|nr:ABC transporter ATP-binding protein [Myroides marinus]MDM1372599.1 ABC transporter ATP-binding protein [Myroides marinus]